MKCKIQNHSRRPISLHCNSGKTFHLPPAYTLELPEEEVKGNAMVEKLASRKLLLVTPQRTGGPAKPASTSPKRSSSPKPKTAN